MRKFWSLVVLLIVLINNSCQQMETKHTQKEVPFIWEAATVYFLLTDRFNNGDVSNDVNFDRTEKTSLLRGFEGGDIQGITQKIKEGYFNDLGINAIWLTPIVEQIHGAVDEGTGVTYGYHGYWTKDWTALDPNFGTKEDLKEMVDVAHAHGIRVLLDAVINHRGPVTEKDANWNSDWVRTGPACTYRDYEATVSCTLVENLPDVKTENNQEVSLPDALVEKWKSEGRYEQELVELDAFFLETGYPRAPRFYIMKWLADYILEFGIDGYRADTVKHTEASVWKEFQVVCKNAFAKWKKTHPEKVLDANDFYTVAEVYNYNISSAKAFDFGDKKVNYFENGFNSVINFEFKYNATGSYESLFSRYSTILQNELKGVSVLNYFTSHDDGAPFDKNREKSYEAAIKLLLAPGTSQIYYGDESNRAINIKEASGDASLRSFMNWEAISSEDSVQKNLTHWQKIGKFRKNHPSVGAGVHQMISEAPYLFSRKYTQEDFEDVVVVGLDLNKGKKELNLGAVFEEGVLLKDAYSGVTVVVKNNQISIDTPFDLVLLEIMN